MTATQNDGETSGVNGTNAAAMDAPVTTEPAQTRVTWDDSAMQTSFANVINVINTREEFTLLFGSNQTWNSLRTRELTVKLANQIVLTPYAAKRLLTLLQVRVGEYEKRFGEMKLAE